MNIIEISIKLEDILGINEWEKYTTDKTIKYSCSKPEYNNFYTFIEIYENKIIYFRSENLKNSYTNEGKQTIEYTFYDVNKFIEWIIND